MPPRSRRTKKEGLSTDHEKYLLAGMIVLGEVSFEDTAAELFRDNEVFHGHSLSKFLENWDELKEDLKGSGKFRNLCSFQFLLSLY